MATWAQEQVDAAAGDLQTPTDSDAWPAAWGTLGESLAASPFSVIHPEKLPDGWEAKAQTQKHLCGPPSTDYLGNLFSPLGYDAQVGFSMFEKYSRYAMYEVAIPDFEPEDVVDDSYIRVPIGSISKGFLSVAGVCFLLILKEYVVRW